MPAWWNSLETMTTISGWARFIGLVLTVLAAICAVVIFVSGRQVDKLKGEKEADRHLIGEKKGKFLEALKQHPMGHVRLESPLGDAEANALMHEVVSALNEAGWNVPPENFSFNVWTVSPVGITIMQRDAGPGTPTSDALSHALILAGFPVAGVSDANLPEDETVLIIGKKP